MSYGLLGQDLHETADRAKKWFAEQYGARRFKCELPVMNDLPLRPTWQADLRTGYSLCINVQPTPFSPTLHEFVSQAASRGLPIKLWVAVAEASPRETFSADLKQAHNVGVGVVQLNDSGAHEYHRSVPLSLFALSRTDLRKVPKPRREVFKNAEDTFLDGAPDQGCQAICQELELISRQFAEEIHKRGWWTLPKGAPTVPARFFTKDPWASMLEETERRAAVGLIAKRCPGFGKQVIVRTRSFTDWRNDVSHRPKNQAQLKARDAKLRTMFEATRDLLVDWCHVAGPLGLLK